VYCATPDLLALVYTERPDARFLPNPIDTVLFSPYQEALVASDRDLLVGVRLDPAKGLDAVLAILTSLRELRPQTTLTIVAQGRGARAALGAAGPRAEAVLPRAHSAMPDLLRAHRVALGQWQVGAIGNYELEALACGIPVAARFAYPEAYDRPPPLIVGDRPEATAAAIATLLDDAQLRARMAGDARRWLVDHHDVGLIAAAVSADYRRWLEDVRDPA
jgi:glycosyltransferase involved in cell wall biosynthesis